ncbi:hypothetical protein INT45_003516 [Circinella minor]|uniref:Uncharacterized protein n=1 Tax=Circinella minor TaxID=1195481 RepID=A0A8H7RU65_9FUNG|nr:hypothetical protein INT45_003516 [Circinella minor]
MQQNSIFGIYNNLPVKTKIGTYDSRSPQLSPVSVLQGVKERNIQEPIMIGLTLDSDKEDEGDEVWMTTIKKYFMKMTMELMT